MKKRLFLHFGIVVFTALLLANCKNPVDSPETTVVNIAAIQGVTAPVTGGTTVTAITGNAQYSGTVTWSPAVIGTVKIDMYDSAGDGWNGAGALRINVNGTDIATNVKVQSGFTNTYTFNVAPGDVIQLYWVAGAWQEENSFIVYYTDTPPSPEFTASNNNSWNGSNALVYKLRGTMNGITGGTLLGSFAGPGGFAAATQYTATITLTAKSGYTLQGVSSNFFTVPGAATVSNSADSGIVTAKFPQTAQGNQTPVAGDYDISGTEPFFHDGSAGTVTVTAKSGKSAGAVTVKYNGSTEEPSDVGTYTVTFDVAAATGWNAATGLSAGTLMILGPVEMVYVPGGSFQMGKELGTAGSGDIAPVHTVTLTGFSMGKYQVTQAQYQAVTGTNPSSFSSSPVSGEVQGNRPVENVSWYEAIVFCNKLSKAEGLSPAYRISGSTDPSDWGTVPTSSDSTWNSARIVAGSNGYRLPTEAQWEYVAKGGNGTPGNYTYSGSNTVGDVAWYDGNSGSKTHEVGKKKPNGLGIYDMSGNMFEWCWDWYNVYPSEAQTDPQGAGSGADRVLRGGSWGYNAAFARSVNRDSGIPYSRSSYYGGFRLARP